MIVEIEVTGGVATVKTKSKGVHLVIRDFDNEEAGDAHSIDIYTDDEEIKDYQERPCRE